jgi:hypothetical protein
MQPHCCVLQHGGRRRRISPHAAHTPYTRTREVYTYVVRNLEELDGPARCNRYINASNESAEATSTTSQTTAPTLPKGPRPAGEPSAWAQYLTADPYGETDLAAIQRQGWALPPNYERARTETTPTDISYNYSLCSDTMR